LNNLPVAPARFITFLVVYLFHRETSLSPGILSMLHAAVFQHAGKCSRGLQKLAPLHLSQIPIEVSKESPPWLKAERIGIRIGFLAFYFHLGGFTEPLPAAILDHRQSPFIFVN
jgi:hypothetical protein